MYKKVVSVIAFITPIHEKDCGIRLKAICFINSKGQTKWVNKTDLEHVIVFNSAAGLVSGIKSFCRMYGYTLKSTVVNNEKQYYLYLVNCNTFEQYNYLLLERI